LPVFSLVPLLIAIAIFESDSKSIAINYRENCFSSLSFSASPHTHERKRSQQQRKQAGEEEKANKVGFIAMTIFLLLLLACSTHKTLTLIVQNA
jgi:hypothetical protein